MNEYQEMMDLALSPINIGIIILLATAIFIYVLKNNKK